MNDTLLDSVLETSAARGPDRVALVAGERRVTFGELDAQANRLAHALLTRGVRRGDRVVVQLDNCVEAVAALFAALKAGACFLMVNPTTRPRKLAFLLDDARASALVLPKARVAACADDLACRPHLRTILSVGGVPDGFVRGKATLAFEEACAPGAAPDSPPEKRVRDRALAGLLYTSGSTGDPKGVMLTHRNIVTVTRAIVEYLHLVDEDVLFDVLPLSFGYGLTQLFSAFAVGARLVAENGMTFPHLTLTRLAAERATGFAMVPTTAAMLLRADLRKYDLSSLRYLTNAGAGLAPAEVRRLRTALPHVELVCMYGQTECMRALYLEPAEVDRRTGSVGRGMPYQDLYLLDEGVREVAPEEVGELVVRGAHVMLGYWRQAEATARKLRPLPAAIRARDGIPDGERALYTGDLFRRDAEGYFYFVGRSDDIFKSRGEKVSPYEVESAIYELPGIAEAVVVGVPDPVLGCAVKAIVVARPGAALTVEEVRRHCARCLEDHLVPREVEFRTELPKNERGKIVRHAV